MTDPINPIQNGAKNRSDQSTNWQSSVDRNFTKKLRRRLYGIYMIYTPRIQHGIFFSSRTIILQNTVWFKTYGVHQHRLSSNQNMPHKMTTILNCVEHVWTTKSLGLWPIRFFSGDLLASWWRLSSRAGMPKGDECWMLECWMSISPFFLGGWRIWRFMGFNLREGYMHEKMENS